MTQDVIWEGSRGKEEGRQDKYEIGMKQEELKCLSPNFFYFINEGYIVP